MDSTVCVLYLYNEELLKNYHDFYIHIYFFLFLRNKEKRVCFHLYLLFYSCELFVILNRIPNNNFAISQLIMLERNLFSLNCVQTQCINNSVYTLHLIKNTVCKIWINISPKRRSLCFHGQNETWALGLKNFSFLEQDHLASIQEIFLKQKGKQKQTSHSCCITS